MSSTRAVKIFLLFFLLIVPLALTPRQSTPKAPLYDAGKWALMGKTEAIFDKSQPAEVLLLKSTQVTGRGGADQPLNDVQLLVNQDGRMVYDYAKQEKKPTEFPNVNATRFFMDDFLELRDVTGDSMPEIMFHSGYPSASNYLTLEHILHFDKNTATFRDIADKEFYATDTHGVRWLAVGKRAILVIARRGKWDLPDLDTHCHFCSSRFVYDAYQWNERRHMFVQFRSIDSTKSYGEVSMAFGAEWPYIEMLLRR